MCTFTTLVRQMLNHLPKALNERNCDLPLYFLSDHYTALRNHNRTVFEEMTSWTVLTRHVGMKTRF